MKKLITLALLLCSVSANAEIPNVVDTLIGYIKLQVFGTTTANNISDVELISYLNRSLSSQPPGGIQKYDTVYTNDSTALYALNSDFLAPVSCIKFIAKDTGNNAPAYIYPLDFAPDVRSAESLWTKGGGATGSKTKTGVVYNPRYAIVFSDNIMFYPQPTDSSMMIIGYYSTHPKVEVVGDTLITGLKDVSREAVLRGAILLLKNRMGLVGE